MSLPPTVAVIVHWRHPEETLGCLADLRGVDGVRAIVVDNGGSPPIRERLPADVEVVRSEHNVGYAGGANLGIRAALVGGAAIVAVLNDDARVLPGAWAAAATMLASDPRIAVVGPKVQLRDEPGALWLAWGDVTWRQSLVALHGDRVPDGPAFAAVRDVDWIAGCAMWLRADALRALGEFDERFFAYHEEVEWCTRARRAGWRVVYAPAVGVAHGGRGTGGSPASIRIRKYFTARNSVLFARKHGTVAQRMKLAAFLGVALPLQWLRHLPAGDAADVVLKMRAIRDALADRPPPFEELGLR